MPREVPIGNKGQGCVSAVRQPTDPVGFGWAVWGEYHASYGFSQYNAGKSPQAVPIVSMMKWD